MKKKGQFAFNPHNTSSLRQYLSKFQEQEEAIEREVKQEYARYREQEFHWRNLPQRHYGQKRPPFPPKPNLQPRLTKWNPPQSSNRLKERDFPPISKTTPLASESSYLEYMPSMRSIQTENLGINGKIGNLKKSIIKNYQNLTQLRIFYSSVYPMLILSYWQGENKREPQYKHLRQVLREVPSLRHKVGLFDDIFSRIYSKVQEEYYSLVVFALEKSDQLGMIATENDFLRYSEENTVMFYYQKTPTNQINFTIFDKRLRCIEFGSSFISKFINKYPSQYLKFRDFFDKVFMNQPQQPLQDLFDRQEIQSDGEDPPAVDINAKSPTQVELELNQYLNKDLSQLSNRIQKLRRELKSQLQLDQQGKKPQLLLQKIEELEEGKANYERVREMVRNYVKKADKQRYAGGLKQLIIASRQMESRLPIITKKRKIIEMIKQQNLLIIEAQTGSGKSTQLPQILAEYYRLYENPQARPVLVAQPRRLATRSLAQRVAREMGQTLGGFVDYVASAGRTPNAKAKILFKLDRLVLDELTQDPLLSKYSCLMIDQAHERTINIDLILGLVKNLLTKRSDFKVLVTSASMDIELFESYFNTTTLTVKGRNFPVTIEYKDYRRQGGKDLASLQKITKVINETILYDDNTMNIQFRGHLLCFCSSVDQINQLLDIYQNKLNPNVFQVLPLHGKISPNQQQKVFEATRKHKLIFASRIAETAITIDGVRVVIDPGEDTELIYDQQYKISTMKVVEISQSSAKQRAGRSGRTAPGYCFRLYSQSDFRSRVVCKVAEMDNSSLQTVALRLKSLRIQNVIDFPYVSKPDSQNLKRSLELLVLIGALSGQTQTITKIGEILIKIPIDPFLSRAILQGIIYQAILHDNYSDKLANQQAEHIKENGIVQTIVSILSLLVNFSNLFLLRQQHNNKAQVIKYCDFADEDGDFLFLRNIYKKYQAFVSESKIKEGYLKQQDMNALKQWAGKNYLNIKSLIQAQGLVKEINNILLTFKVHEAIDDQLLGIARPKIEACKTFKQLVLSCLITSFAPYLCKFTGNPQIGYTLVSQRRPIKIYETSNLALMGITADWIISYQFYTNKLGTHFCKFAHQVPFKFIQQHTSALIQERLQLQKIQDHNPFYERINYSLPTSIIKQIMGAFYKGKRHEDTQFLQQTYPVFEEDKNEITFFVLRQEEMSQEIVNSLNLQLSSQQLIDKLREFVEQRIEGAKQTLRYNYMGNIFINLKDSFQVEDIQFDNTKQTVFDIISLDSMVDYIQKSTMSVCRSEVFNVSPHDPCIKRFKECPYSNLIKRIMMKTDQQEATQLVDNFIQSIKDSYSQVPLCLQKKILEHRKRIPRSKLALYFFSGVKKPNSILFLSYPTANHKSPAVQMSSALVQAFRRLKIQIFSYNSKEEAIKRKVQAYQIDPDNIKLSKNQNGINIFQTLADEFEIKQLLYSMIEANRLSPNFVMPKYFTIIRKPQYPHACKEDDAWKRQILSILEGKQIPTKDLTINIKCNYALKEQKINQYEGYFKGSIKAQLLGFDYNYLDTLKKAIDNKYGIIGSQKLHLKAYCDQVLALPKLKLFEGLEQEYDRKVSLLRQEFPTLRFQKGMRVVKNSHRIAIIGLSPNKQDFIKPQRILHRLFSPRLMKLQSHEYSFLEKTQQGQTILDKIAQQYTYRVFFDFNRHEKLLKVYCEDNQFKLVQQRIKEQLELFQHLTQRIPYNDKNLNIVIDILKGISEKKHNFIYQILFLSKEVEITANFKTLEEVKRSLLQLQKSQKVECQICGGPMKCPYRFINCYCVFCWHCIAEYIRQFYITPQTKLYCPSQSCYQKKTPINIHDFKALLSEAEFTKVCEHKSRLYLQNNPSKVCFLCKFCDNILDKRDASKDLLNCEICGRNWCMKCTSEFQDTHRCKAGISERDRKQFESMGIKFCPKCGEGIQKDKGCNHMTCTRCKAHICWKCLKMFESANQCYDHLAKQCGGIFDQHYRDEQSDEEGEEQQNWGEDFDNDFDDGFE